LLGAPEMLGSFEGTLLGEELIDGFKLG